MRQSERGGGKTSRNFAASTEARRCGRRIPGVEIRASEIPVTKWSTPDRDGLRKYSQEERERN